MKYAFLLIFLVALTLGCVSQPQATTIKIGVTLPLTGDVANFGIDSQNAINMAVEEINSQVGVNGKNITLIFEDDKCDGKESVKTVSKLINVDKVSAIIGPFCSAALLPAAPLAENAKVIMFSGSATNARITQAGDYVFRNIPSDAFQGKFAAEFVFNTLKARKVAVEYANEEYSVGLKDVFTQRFTELGGQIVLSQAHDRGAADLRTQITKIRDTSADLVYLAAFPVDGGNFMRQTKDLGLKTNVLGSEALNDPQVIEIAQESANGLMFTTPKPLTTQEFKNKFQSKFGKEPLVFSDYYYDVVYLLANTMKACGENSECIKNELYKVKDYKGVLSVLCG